MSEEKEDLLIKFDAMGAVLLTLVMGIDLRKLSVSVANCVEARIRIVDTYLTGIGKQLSAGLKDPDDASGQLHAMGRIIEDIRTMVTSTDPNLESQAKIFNSTFERFCATILSVDLLLGSVRALQAADDASALRRQPDIKLRLSDACERLDRTRKKVCQWQLQLVQDMPSKDLVDNSIAIMNSVDEIEKDYRELWDRVFASA